MLTDGTDQSGNVAFNGTIDLNKDFTVEGSINVGTYDEVRGAKGIADGIGFAFYHGKKNQVGKNGPYLGICGITNAIGWKIDTWYNSEFMADGQNDVGIVDSSAKDAYGAFITTDKQGYGSIDTSSVQRIPKDNLYTGHDNPITFQYTASSKTMMVSLTVYDTGTKYTFSNQVNFDQSDPFYYFTIVASTGNRLPTKHSFILKSFKYFTQQIATIDYFDDDTGTKLTPDSIHGHAGDKMNYSTAQRIKDYESQGYELVSDGFAAAPASEKVFDNDDTKDQSFEVHLKHQTKNEVKTKTITRTIKYIGVPNPLGAKVQPVTFKRTATIDAVTNNVISYEAWDKTSQTFTAVNSPEVPGYIPDQAIVSEKTVGPDDKDEEITVTYTAIPTTVVQPGDPNPVDANIKLDTVRTIKQTIKYTGTSNKLPDNTQTVIFKRTAIINAKTGKLISYGPWDKASQTFTAVNSPEVLGYTPDQASVSEKTVGPDDKDEEITVTYTAIPTTVVQPGDPNPVDANIKLDTVRTIKQTIKYTGTSNKLPDNTQTVIFKRTAIINAKTGKLISYGPWDKASQTFTAVNSPEVLGYTPDQASVSEKTVGPDDKDEEITVTYTAIPTTVVQPGDPNPVDANIKLDTVRTIKQTIKYTGTSNKLPDNTQTVIFKRTAIINAKTGKLISYGPWDKASQTFTAVNSPEVLGYTPDQASVSEKTVGPDDKDEEITVTYTAIPVSTVKVTIEYQDADKQNAVIATDSVTGKPGDDVTTQTQLNKLLSQGYVYVESRPDLQIDQKHLVILPQKAADGQKYIIVLRRPTNSGGGSGTPSNPNTPSVPVPNPPTNPATPTKPEAGNDKPEKPGKTPENNKPNKNKHHGKKPISSVKPSASDNHKGSITQSNKLKGNRHKAKASTIKHHKQLSSNAKHNNVDPTNKITSAQSNAPLDNKNAKANTLPQTGQSKHSNAALLAIGGLMVLGALGGVIISGLMVLGALGGAIINRKKRN